MTPPTRARYPNMRLLLHLAGEAVFLNLPLPMVGGGCTGLFLEGYSPGPFHFVMSMCLRLANTAFLLCGK